MMTRRLAPPALLVSLLLVVQPTVIDGVERRHRRAPAGAHADVTSRFSQLLVDVDQSIRKAGREGDAVFAQLYGYDHELDASLGREITLLNATRHRLTALQAKFRSKTRRSEAQIQKLGVAVAHSEKTKDKYESSSAEADKKFNSLLGTAQWLMDVLQAAAAMPGQGQVSPKSVESLRTLLKAHGELQHRFADVFSALAVGRPNGKIQPLTGQLLARSVSAVQEITSHLHKRRSGVLLQLQVREQQLSGVETKAALQTELAQGVEEEEEQKAEELAFSVSFTDSVLKSDQSFLNKVQKIMKEKNSLVDGIRVVRKKQLTTIEDLVDLLNGKFSVPTGATTPQAVGVSLLQEPGSLLQDKIEAAIRHRASTHGFLMHVKSVLDQVAPIDTESIRDVMAKMGSALKAVDTVEASADDASRQCEQQQFRADQENTELKKSVENMGISKNHTDAAIKATKKNLEGIASKSTVLSKSTSQFARMAAGSMKTLNGQSHDRGMIMAALKKAKEMVPQTDQKQSADALLDQLMNLLQFQDKSEQTYKAQQEALRADLDDYTSGYEQLLTERRAHYERTLSALELYSSELAGDTAARKNSLEEESEIKDDGADLCSSILSFYKKHNERRTQLSSALRAALPKLPEILERHTEAAAAVPAEGDAVSDALAEGESLEAAQAF